MIHHLARAFFARDAVRQSLATAPDNEPRTAGARSSGSTQAPGGAPVRPRPITPWTAPVAPGHHKPEATSHRVRISTDPSDARRTVISGRFAEVCAALDRLVHEQEAMA